MKKRLLFLVVPVFFLVACSMSNTPTSKAEELFSKYQTLDNEIDSEITMILNEQNLTESQKERYRKILEKQYKNLTYQIKDEKIDGDTALVTAEIEVLDLKHAIDNLLFDSSIYTKQTYDEEKLSRLESVKNKVKYTLELTVEKDDNGNWHLNNLTNDKIKKIQGMY